MNTISRHELKSKFDAGQQVKLVLMLSDCEYQARHIPGSLHFPPITLQMGLVTPDLATLHSSDEIVVYSADATCPAARLGYHLLKLNGYRKVRLYEGGIADWEAAGYPLEGKRLSA